MSKAEQRIQEFGKEGKELREAGNRKVEQQIWDNCPIKQFVRRYGWLEIVKHYLERRQQIGVMQPWSYLTLPGANASDVGVLYAAKLFVRDENGKLPVAVCDVENGDKVFNNLQDVGGILTYSRDFLHVALQKTEGKDALYRFFPFDVINLDFCESLFPVAKDNGIQILRSIFNYQRGQSFLLLVTTKPDPSPFAAERYKEIVKSNLDGEPAFKEAYISIYGNDNVEECMQDYTRFTQIIIPKVIARMAKEHGYRADEHFAAKYERPFREQRENSPTGYDMVCHTIELEAIHLGNNYETARYKPRRNLPSIPKTDPVILNNLPSKVQAKALDDYADFVSQLPGRVVQDVVEHLRQNPEQERQLAEEARLLDQWWQHAESGM